MTVETDMGLFDSDTGESLKAIKSVDMAIPGKDKRIQMLFTKSKRGRIVQFRQDVLRIHYFLDEERGREMMDEACGYFGLAPGQLYAAAIAAAPPKIGDGFVQYRRKQIAEFRPYKAGEDLVGVSISGVDQANGSPKEGDMIARNPVNHEDKWLVAAAYFADNFEPI